jgi:hypothetical protein
MIRRKAPRLTFALFVTGAGIFTVHAKMKAEFHFTALP